MGVKDELRERLLEGDGVELVTPYLTVDVLRALADLVEEGMQLECHVGCYGFAYLTLTNDRTDPEMVLR